MAPGASTGTAPGTAVHPPREEPRKTRGKPRLPGEKKPPNPRLVWQRARLAVPWGRMGRDAPSRVMGWGLNPALAGTALLSAALGLQKGPVREFKGLKLSLFYA